MSNYIGDVDLSKTFYARFATVNASGVPTTLGNSPSLEYYVNGGSTGFTSGLTLTTDFNSRTGLNSVAIVVTTSCTGLVTATDISICIAAGTVSGVSLVGYPVIGYSIAKRSALRPATADRTLIVSSTGYGAIDWNAIGTPGATQSLSATTLFTATNVTNNVGAVVTACNTVVPANVTTASTNIGAVVTASSINIGAVVTAINTIAPARVTAQGIDVGAIVTSISTIAPARVTAQGIDVGAIVTAINTIAPARVTAVAASGLAAFFLTSSGTTYASSTAGSVVYEIANNAGVEASGLAAIVWEAEQTANGTVAGSFGKYLDTAISSRLAPAVSGRSLLVSSTGYGAIDWNSIGTPGATVSLSATTLFTTTNVTNNVGAVVTAINTIAPARVTAQGIDVGAIVTSISTIAPARVTAQGIDVGAIVTAINTIAPARVTAQGIDVGAIVTSISTIAPARVTAQGINVGAVVTAIATTTAVQSGLATIWDATLASHLNSGSTGEALNAAGSAGDPWVTALPGAYGAGSAGNILGTVVQAAVTAIQAKTTGLSFTVAGQVDANIQYVNDTEVTGTGASGNEWGPV